MYSQGNPRLGKWIVSRYKLIGLNTLEIGAGSGRESKFISKMTSSSTCVDFSPKAIELLKTSKLPPNMNVVQADAFMLPFPDAHFDVTFHKGVWVLFDNDLDIVKMLDEQIRITKSIALAVVQNARNSKQVRDAAIRSSEDPLFKIRFFDPAELLEIGYKSISKLSINARVKVLKYGNPSISKKLYPLGQTGDFISSKVYNLLPWANVECAVLEIVLG